MVLTGLALWLVFRLVYAVSTSDAAMERRLQKTVAHYDAEMQRLTKDGIDYEAFDKAHIGLYVFQNDSLVYWNQNELNPKLMKRKVGVDNDTLCQLANGDYYVKSFHQGATSYFAFKLLKTHYPIDNHYFNDVNVAMPWYVKHDRYLSYALLVLVLVGLALVFANPTNKEQERNPRWLEIGAAAILMVSLLATYLYDKIALKRENESIINMAENLSQKRDIRFELSFAGFAELVKTDTDLRDMVFGESNVLADVVLDYSKGLLFDDNMNAYLVTLTICAPEEEITVQPEGYIADCEEYFVEKLDNHKQNKVGEGLYFMDYYTLDPNYVGKIEVCSEDSLQKKNLFFEFYKPVAPEGFSFPLLLQENHSSRPYDYSVANYRDSLLVYKYGRYVYPNFVTGMRIDLGAFSYGKRFKHYAVNHGENDILVITAARHGWSEVTAPFSLFFLGLMVPFLLLVWLRSPRKPRKWRDRSFRQRLQTVILLTLVVSFLVVGPVSVIFMRSLYNQNKANTQFETTRTLVNEMRNDIDFGSVLMYGSRDRWDELLQRYANTFFTDINVYQLNGQLLATTRHEIFDLNLQAPWMNAEAYQNLHRNHALFYTHEERLGNGIYESSYLPLNDLDGNTLAYLNTPYFSSTTDLQKEIKNFVLTYLNIILVLLSFALVFVLRITKRLTQPLALIQNKLRGLTIDGKNESIEWRGNDEIGALVKQYNQLIVELERSAAELRRTATESAWRGVARQVAHEIHNSLTPMRLSVQMLQRSAEQQGGDVAEHIQRTSATLLEQIDALSDIASSFSQYAKLPVNNPQPLDLAELIGNLVNLYDNAANIEFVYEVQPEVDYTFNGDKTNLNSAIGNIIKNATQAIGTKLQGRVGVKLQSTETAFVVSVKDNGKGIKEEDKKMIFVPNFTTKTNGSGVGLSLAYNIILSAGGSITFESQEGEGTEFVIELPRGAK